MTENEFNYWAFLSYSQQDNGEQRPEAPAARHLCWCDWLRDVLKSFPIPAEFAGQINARGEVIPERIEPLFQDTEEQPGNARLSDPVRQALEQSRCLIVICSPRSAQSLHVNEAVRYFKQLGRGNRVLPLVVAGEPNVSESARPGLTPENECFVPALRHPVKSDGTLETARRERGTIFADARHGEDKREILVLDLQQAETKLETAKIQLIAGLIGVGFNGLWGREQRRRFAEAQVETREARHQAQAAQHQVQEARSQAQEAQRKVVEAEQQARAAQTKVLELENQAREAQSQIQAARNQAQEAQAKVLEAQQQAREAQNKVLELENQTREAQRQIQEASSQIQAARKQAQEAQQKLLEAQTPAPAAEPPVQANQSFSEDEDEDEDEGPAVQQLVQAAQSEAQAAQSQLREAQEQARAAQHKVQELESQAREAQRQTQEARSQAQAAQSKVLETDQHARQAQMKVEEIENQAREAENRIQEARSLAQAAQIRGREAQNQLQQIRQRTLTSRRLTRIFALIAVLALLAAGMALRQRKLASQALAKAAATEMRESELAAGQLTGDQMRQALRSIGGTEQAMKRQRSLEELAARIPTEGIPEALKAAADMVDDRQRSHFQKQLLVRLGRANPVSAMACAGAVAGKIVNDDGVGDSCAYFQLAVLEQWLRTNLPGALDWVRQLPEGGTRQRALAEIIPALAADNPQNALGVLNALKPAPGEPSYTRLFQRWAAQDPVQAIQHRQEIPGQDGNDRMLGAILAVWVEQQPEAAWNWVQSQPESESKNQAREICIWQQAKTDVSKALALTESLPEGTWRNAVMAGLFKVWATNDLEAATTACQQLPEGLAKAQAWEGVLNRRIETAPASAAAYVTNLPAGDYRQFAVAALGRYWADTDVAAAVAWAQSLPSVTEQVAAFNQIVPHWARKDAPAALQFANQHPGLSDEAWGRLAAAWSKSDLTAATNWVASLPDGEKKDAVLLALAKATAESEPALAASFCTQLTTTPPGNAIVQSIANAWAWAGNDLPSAVEWACSLPADTPRHAALSALSAPWAQRDPEGLAAYALGLPAGEAQTQYLTLACRQLAARDLPEVIESLQSLADPALRRRLLEQAGRDCDLSQINQAAGYIAALPAGEDQQAAVKGLLSRWNPVDPGAALNWLNSFPETNAQTELMQSALQAWSQTEPAAAANWLAQLPARAASESTVSAFLAGAVVKYPEFAGQWTQSVTNEVQRHAYQMQVAREWVKSNPAAAWAWINSLEVSNEIGQTLKAPAP